MAKDTGGVADFKREVDEAFDQALAEVSAALDAVPRPHPLTLPGLEPPPELASENIDGPAIETAAPDPNPLQGRFDLAGRPVDGDEHDDDPITAFAPDEAIDWGPRGHKLSQRDDADDRT